MGEQGNNSTVLKAILEEGRIGKKLVDENLISDFQLEEALLAQQSRGGRLGDNLIALGYLTESRFSEFLHKKPLQPVTLEDTGLELSFLAGLAMKHILLLGEFKMADISEAMKLPLPVIDKILEMLQKERFIEVKGSSEYARFAYRFAITGLGQNKAVEMMELCRYVGPAPVSLDRYREMIRFQTIKNVVLHQEELAKAFTHMVIEPQLLKRLGPALTSGRAIFLYGPPGNGKTSIAETMGNVLPETVYIPYSIYVGGQVISVFDPVNHIVADGGAEDDNHDKRWRLIKRPVIMVGGELTLRTLDLEFNAVSKFYTAPLQMKANNGFFIIDDFGRQLIDPKTLLNRWIVPLDRRVDFMTLHTGMKFEVPFDQLIIFSTNLAPRDLVDEAFLRRIRYKIKIDYPSDEGYETIFKKICDLRGVAFNQDVFEFLKDNYYRKLGVKPSANHPRDLIDHIIDQSRYYRHPPEMNIEGLRDAWESYFVEM